MSRIISFDWTTLALLAGRKTRSRRNWKPSHAAKFKAGGVYQAWDHQPRTGKGAKKADIRFTADPYWQLLADMPDEDYEAEGFAFFQEHPEIPCRLPGLGPGGMSWAYWEWWKAQPGGLYVLSFELEEVVI